MSSFKFGNEPEADDYAFFSQVPRSTYVDLDSGGSSDLQASEIMRISAASQGPHLVLCDWDKLEAVFFCLLHELLLEPVLVLYFLLCEDCFIIGMPVGKHVEDDASQFVSCGGDGLGRSQFGAHAAIVLAQPRLAAEQRLRGHAQRPCRAVVHLAGVRTEYFAAAYAVVRA